ncbi:hypothetical protein KQY27_00855 [Methanobrevibacter sp. TMH8]|uniref:hypothetical protein n=1 Tax=Methanobrevibacter sp. TMH8 TaxID=2848611 RepID=UPI001CC910C7|nr:hypothetical protein [Methanobrevibacter sp. TMH8]MBZ9570103.1 hypothetical protein [Methanobrevibacter sp. TMH8]
MDEVQSGSRTAELVLGIIGGVFGLIGATAALFLGAGFNVDSAMTGGLFSILFSIIAIIAVVFISKNPKIISIVLILSALVIFITSGLFGFLGAILILIAGILGLVRK